MIFVLFYMELRNNTKQIGLKSLQHSKVKELKLICETISVFSQLLQLPVQLLLLLLLVLQLDLQPLQLVLQLLLQLLHLLLQGGRLFPHELLLVLHQLPEGGDGGAETIPGSWLWTWYLLARGGQGRGRGQVREEDGEGSGRGRLSKKFLDSGTMTRYNVVSFHMIRSY